MKIAFLRPNLGGQRSNDAIEPLGFAVLSGLTDRKKHEVLLFDERIEDIPMDLEVDLVVITTFTLTAKRAYTIADNYRKKVFMLLLVAIMLHLFQKKFKNMQILFLLEVQKGIGQDF